MKMFKFFAMILLILMFYQPISCQEGEAEGEKVPITVIVNNEEIVIQVLKEYLPFITELTKQIVESVNGDLDECQTPDIHGCDLTVEVCVNLDGSFHCPCIDGYVRQTSEAECEVDLCRQNGTNCTDLRICNNEVTDLQCICQEGYVENGTMCELVTPCRDNGNCGENAVCEVSGTSHTCTCHSGYEEGTGGSGSGSGPQNECEDIDECTTNQHDCHANAGCTNNDGSFVCTCSDGYSGDGQTCQDINECEAGSSVEHDCSDRSLCGNIDGSFTCTCYNGFTGDGRTCEDIDECATGEANCHSTLATCTNTVGSFECSCNAGFSGNGKTCEDIDECSTDQDNCHDNAECNDTEGSFSCSCSSGYIGDGVDCADIDECESDQDNCLNTNAMCTNTEGSFVCSCNDGFTGNGVNSCTDIDECSTDQDNCHDNAECIDTEGSFSCSCSSGYTGNGVDCTDIDECTSGTHNCNSVTEQCSNTPPGTFTCDCAEGYERHESGFCGRIGGTITATFRTRTSGSRRRRMTTNFGTELTNFLKQLLTEFDYGDADLNIEVVSETKNDDGSTTFELLVSADPEVRTFLQNQLTDLKGKTFGDIVVDEIFYKETLTVEGEVDITGTTLTGDDICSEIVDHVNMSLADSVTNTTQISCEATVDGTNVNVNVTVDGANSGSVDLGAILQSFNGNFNITETVTCEANSCAPNGTCSDEAFGSIQCSCSNNLYDHDITKLGTTCVNPIHTIQCTKDSITVGLYKGYFTNLGIEASEIHLTNKSCTGTLTATTLQFFSSIGTCGWEAKYPDNETVVYKNNVTNVVNGAANHAVAIMFPVECSYSTKIKTSDSEQPPVPINVVSTTIIVQNAFSTGELEVTVTAYEDEAFSNMLSNDTIFEFDDELYIELTQSVSSSDNYLKATSCWTTPSSDPDDETNIQQITDECPNSEGKAEIISNGDGQTAKFLLKVRPFVFSTKLYVHCDVEVCESSCQKTCPPSSRRRKRSSGNNGNRFTIGPFNTEGTEEGDGDTAENTAPASSPTLAIALGCIAAVLLLGLVILVVHRVRKRSNRYEGIRMTSFW